MSSADEFDWSDWTGEADKDEERRFNLLVDKANLAIEQAVAEVEARYNPDLVAMVEQLEVAKAYIDKVIFSIKDKDTSFSGKVEEAQVHLSSACEKITESCLLAGNIDEVLQYEINKAEYNVLGE